MTIPDIRTGHGIDTHALEAGDSIRLCGVDIKHDKKLVGHSDADVALHALTDAMLATIALGDIGTHFPPSDKQWKNKESKYFLEFAVKEIEKRKGVINHCDVTLICQEPLIAPHKDDMRQCVADIVGIEVDRVSVKATTNEGLGYIGRGEGITAVATVTVILQ